MAMWLLKEWYHAGPIALPYTENAGARCEECRMCRCSLRIILACLTQLGSYIRRGRANVFDSLSRFTYRQCCAKNLVPSWNIFFLGGRY